MNYELRMKFSFLLLCLVFCFNLEAKDGEIVDNQTYTKQVLSEKEKRKFDYFFLEALNLKHGNKYADAFNTFQYCLSIDSTSAATHYELSRFYIYLGNYDLGLNALKKAVQYDSERYDYLIALANFLRELRKNEEAIVIFEQLRNAYPNKTELHYFLSDLYIRQNNIDSAIKELDAVEETSGMDETLSIQKYRLYTMIEKNEEAFGELEKLADKYPYDAKYQILIGDLYLEKKEMEKAYQFYQKAHAIDPENPYYIVSMANYYEHQGNQELAEKEIDMALRNPKLDIETKLVILGRHIQNLYENKNEIENANILFETLMEQHPQEPELNLMYGSFLLAQEKIEEAKFQFQLVTESSPENIVAWEQLLRISLQENKPENSIEICRAALIHFPETSQFYFYMGLSYHQLKDYENALKSYQDGIQYIGKDDSLLHSDFYGQIGDIYYMLKNKELAYESYEAALKYNDKNINVLNNYAYYLSLDKKDLDKAERMSNVTVKMYPDNSTYLDTYAWIFFVQGNYTLAKFYIESAMSKGGDEDEEILDHYGDILYMTGNVEKAVVQWKKAQEIGKDTETIRKKIAEEKYYEETNEN